MAAITAKITIKHNEVSGQEPDSSFLSLGELAINTADGKLFYKKPNGTIGQLLGSLGGGDEGSGSSGFEQNPKYVPLVIITGESNAGGVAPNDSSGLTGTELGVRPNVKILNNSTLEFESLDVGTNNLINHSLLTNNVTHGMEVGIANRVDSGDWNNVPLYLAKIGHGASTIEEWNEGGSYWTSFQTRVEAIKEQFKGLSKVPIPYIIYSQGINNLLIPVPTAPTVWKTATIAHLTKIRNLLGLVPIFMTKFMTGYEDYDTVMQEISDEMALVYLIDSDNTNLMPDGYHWNSAGLKVMADRAMDLFFSEMGQGENHIIRTTYAKSFKFFGDSSAGDGTVAGPPNILLNGSFEGGAPNEFGLIYDVPFWDIVGSAFAFIGDAIYVPISGARLMVFNANNTATGGVISQPVTTVIGDTYRLKFFIGAAGGPGIVQAIKTEVIGDTTLVDDNRTITCAGASTANWSSSIEYEFTADSIETLIKFTDVSVSGTNVDLLLDSVNMTNITVV